MSERRANWFATGGWGKSGASRRGSIPTASKAPVPVGIRCRFPEGFDYDFWLGPAPEAPYHVERCFHRWRYILDYSNGQTVNFGAHTNDIAQWGLGMDGTTPVEFEDNGSEFLPKGSLFTTASKTAFRARYANGIELTCETRKSSATKFIGTEGRLEVTLGGRVKTFPENLKDSVIGPGEIQLPRSNPAREENVRKHIDADHVRSFLDAVKSRKDPIEPVETGHSTASLCSLGNLAQILKTKFRWGSEHRKQSRQRRREPNAFVPDAKAVGGGVVGGVGFPSAARVRFRDLEI